MTLHRDLGGSDPVRPEPVGRVTQGHEDRHLARSFRLGVGTLACPACDAPVASAAHPMSPADPLACPFCRHTAPVREFLSLTAPSRPARVEVRAVARHLGASGRPRPA